MFKGREMAHKELGQDVLTKITTETAEWGIVESPAKFEGKQLIMYIAPRKK
jgi:translation initiation factor IF-3